MRFWWIGPVLRAECMHALSWARKIAFCWVRHPSFAWKPSETPLGHLFTRFLSFLGVLPRRFSSLPRELKWVKETPEQPWAELKTFHSWTIKWFTTLNQSYVDWDWPYPTFRGQLKLRSDSAWKHSRSETSQWMGEGPGRHGEQAANRAPLGPATAPRANFRRPQTSSTRESNQNLPHPQIKKQLNGRKKGKKIHQKSQARPSFGSLIVNLHPSALLLGCFPEAPGPHTHACNLFL